MQGAHFRIQSLRAKGHVFQPGSFSAEILAEVDEGQEFWKLNLEGNFIFKKYY